MDGWHVRKTGKQHRGSKTLGKVLPALKTITVPSNSFFFLKQVPILLMGFPGSSEGKESAGNAGDLGLIPGSGRSPGKGNGNPLQYSCLENPMDRGACWAIHSTLHKHDL